MLAAGPLATAAVALTGAATLSLPAGVTVTPSGKAERLAGGGLRLPVLGNGPAGTIRLGGRARLDRDGRTVSLSSFELDGERVTAKVDGVNRLDVFALSERKVRTTPRKTTVRARARATRALGLGPVGGLFRLTAKPTVLRLGGGQAELTLDPAFFDALLAEGIEPSAGEGATVADGGAYSFPVSTGRLTAKRLEGSIGTGGGIAFNRDARALLLLEDYVLDTRANTIAGRVDDGARAPLYDVAFPRGTLQDGFVVFGAATVTLAQRAADALNAAFESTSFTAGQTLGSVTVTAEPVG